MIVKRLEILASELKLTVSGLEKKLGLGNSTLSKAISNNRSIGSNIIETIFEHYPTLSPEWFITGKGNIFITNSKSYTNTDYNISQVAEPTPAITPPNESKILLNRIEELVVEKTLLRRELEEIKKTKKKELAHQLVEAE
jgi:hypothetical protein